ncbi:HET-domain-containing protein [Hyaloscypha variabilis F]|uniref:HET-domain-containing protein n=1 Tax=Hyaloscypha variabilis (strain UAMH 11265 / GT02V1 / F) TaxID=1149755 RepID=A0A2J6RUA7_HYAVF|nr:HET-domain-containing protein [Hyaloscypha variabilis F]
MAEKSKLLLEECVTHHSSTCPSDLDVLLPPRVIDVNSIKNSERLSLHISASEERGSYTALSYCWGEPPHSFFTTRSTLQDPSKLDWGQLPATIKDAVTVTRGLGIRYLWVDALCIAQDDEADKSEQIKVMGRIYKTATLTIAAASSNSVFTGFLEDRRVPSIPLPLPLDKRGWTLQGSLLSPRILYYGSKDLIWKCQAKSFRSGSPGTAVS